MSDHEAKQATPHATLLAELLDSRIPKSEREHAAAREVERLTAALRHEADCVDAAKAEIERLTEENRRLRADLLAGRNVVNAGLTIHTLTLERDELRRQLAEAEQRFDWLAERLEDVQIDNTDPNAHYHGDEEDVPYPVLWRRAVNAAMGANNE